MDFGNFLFAFPYMLGLPATVVGASNGVPKMTKQTTKLSRNAKSVRAAASKAATAQRKAQSAQASRTRSRASTKKTPPAKAAPAKAVKRQSPPKRAMTFDLPCASTQKQPRESSKRAKVLAMLQRKNGATHQEVMDAIGWDRVTAYEGIRLLSIHNGYGLRQTGERIHAYVDAPKKSSRRTAKAA